MRQMRKKIIIAIIVTLLLTAGTAFTIGFLVVKGKNTNIKELETRLADIKCVAFSKDLAADSIITPSDIIKIDYKESSLTNGCYFYTKVKDENGKYEKDKKGEYIWEFKKYVAYTDENGVLYTYSEPAFETSLYNRVVKTKVSVNMPILEALLYPESEQPDKDERIQEFNFIQIPSDVNVNDYIDVRIQFPGGEDYSVLIGKKIEKIAGENTIFIKMNEEEIMAMSSAIIEAYMQKGVRLYANKYTDPATQLFNEAEVDYVAKYEYAVEKLMNEKLEIELRKAIAQKFVDKNLYVEVDAAKLGLEANIKGMVKYTANSGDEIIIAGKTTTLTEAKEIDLYIEEVEEDKEKVLLVTVASMNDVTTAIKEDLKENLEEIDIEDLENDILALYAGIEEDYIEEIKLASIKGNEEVLAYYEVMNVITRDSIMRSFPVREEVLAVVKNNPNLVETIKAEFNTVALTNTRIDEYKKLEAEYTVVKAQYAANPYDSSLYTKMTTLENSMKELVDERITNIEKSIESEVAAQKAERVSYLESLVKSTTTTTTEG